MSFQPPRPNNYLYTYLATLSYPVKRPLSLMAPASTCGSVGLLGSLMNVYILRLSMCWADSLRARLAHKLCPDSKLIYLHAVSTHTYRANAIITAKTYAPLKIITFLPLSFLTHIFFTNHRQAQVKVGGNALKHTPAQMSRILL